MNSKDPFCIGYIDYGRAFDSIEHEAIHMVLRLIGVNETYISILEDIYTRDTARVHMDNQVSEEIPILRGMKQADQFPPKYSQQLRRRFEMPR